MGWLGLDDTDTLAGGCTTLVFHQLLENLPSNVSIRETRLVRLWPFAKKRTRGNAAMAAELVLLNDESNVITDVKQLESATKSLLEHLDNWWTEHIAPLEGAVEQSTHNDRPQVPTEPGMVWFNDQPDETFYRMAVAENVVLSQAPTADKSWGSHGIIGATAATSWAAQSHTWEAIAWRDDCSSTVREICERTLSVIDSWQGTFMSRDSRKGRSLIAPRGNCPVLFGVRARDKKTANNAAKKLLESEATQPSSGMRIFMTNQASDDHLNELFSGKVISTKILSRGHVILQIESSAAEVIEGEEVPAIQSTWMAFAQSGDVKNLAQWLQAGDLIKGKGLLADDGALHLEKLKLVEASERNKRRPPCEKCGRTVKSQGKNNKLRCPACKNLQENIWIYNPQNPPHRGWVQPPSDHRRHLARPLKWDQ